MEVCRRCGYVYPGNQPQTGQFGRPLSAASQREFVAAQPANRASNPAALIGVLALLFLLMIAGGAMLFARSANHLIPPPSQVTDMGGQPVRPQMQNPMSGLFVEKAGKSENPKLTITNDSDDTIHLLLKDQTGRVFHIDAGPYKTESADIPAGQYDIAITGDDPTISGNSGDALFRTYKEYSATFVVTSGLHNPIHLGD